MKTQHNLPWSYSGQAGDNYIMSKPLRAAIASVPNDADRVFIVAACNNVERLADALAGVMPIVEGKTVGTFAEVNKAREALAQFELDRLQTPGKDCG